MNRDALPREPHRSRFRTVLVRVLIVQVVALAILGLIQAVYNVSPR
ncbi:MAG TPA: hypothetical protein VMM35_09465 [Longimicrobiales bacterium]|nr:hypothetical protein [Longimicrobiales bacterium]